MLTCVIDRHTVAHIANVFAEKGSDSWWAEPLETLLPPDVLKKVNDLCKHKWGVCGCVCLKKANKKTMSEGYKTTRVVLLR